MASQSLYRRWRSRNFAEIVGQQQVTRTLKNALVQGRMSHAYLFCGSRGIGKTSAARILAKAANCENPSEGEPCGTCRSCVAIGEGRCLDVIEIDAASNRSIDDIRDLRDKINFAPSEVRYKFYILDEVHMLSNDAFNALLKTLEEPPPHAVFVLVTTEPHKLPATVLSRCQRFDFRRISLPDLVNRLKEVCSGEGLQVEPEAIELVGRLSTGSLRDAESLLDQLVSYCGNRITVEDVRMVVGMTGSEAARKLAEHLVERDVSAGLRLINEVAGGGVDLRQFGREVVDYLRKLMLVKVGGVDPGLAEFSEEALADMKLMAARISAMHLVRSIRLFSEIENSQRIQSHSQLPLELAFVEAVLQIEKAEASEPAPLPAHGASGRAPQMQRVLPGGGRPESSRMDKPAVSHQPERATGHLTGDSPPVTPAPDLEETGGPIPSVEQPVASDVADLVRGWNNVMGALGAVDKRIQALMRGCRPIEIEGDTVVLGFFYQFHRDAIDDQAKRAIVEKVLSDVRGTPSRIKCVVSPKEKGSARSVVDDPLVKAAVSMGARIKKVEVRSEE